MEINVIEWIIKYIKGWIIICVEGNNLERFINICNHNSINMMDVTYVGTRLRLKINVKDFKKLKNIGKKTKVHIRIEERYGLPFFLFRNRRRKMFFVGIITSLILVYIMSLYIWQISFVGNYSHTNNELLLFLSDLGIENGIKKDDCDADKIEKAIRNEFNDIKWASIEIVGTRMIVHVKENNNNFVENNNENYDIVANKDAKILSIVTGKGTPLVKTNVNVKKGDILIGGYYEIYSDFGELIETRKIQADGIIIGETKYVINKTINRKYKNKVYTGEISKKYMLSVMDKNIEFDWFYKEYDVYDITEKNNQFVVAENFFLPIYLKEFETKEYKYEEKYYSDEKAYEIGQTYLDDFLQNLIEKGIQITQNNVTIEVDENNVIITGEIICYEYIGEKRIN